MTSNPHAQKTYPVSWDQLHRDSKALAWRLVEAERPWRGIVAIARGGLVPAAIVARELEIRLIDTFCVASYDDRRQGEARILKAATAALVAAHPGASDEQAGAGWLIVDDLVDTGQTARIVREHLPGAHFATVYAKPAGRPLVDTYVTEVSQDTWILFPWDTELQSVPPIVRGVQQP
ncbi:MAG: xanthine phosphoribosyltransferase [Alphaproteobacteria bacterium]|nr:MAG: xanthine phosphoribosyltransferase [Alphaproteobacteria bacterium]